MILNFADRVSNMKASDIREILKVTEQEGFISLAGGLPAPELFPVEDMKIAARQVLDDQGSQALQYSTTEGFVPLRKQIARRMNQKVGTDLTYESIQIVSGSQQALDLTGKLFLNDTDVVICENPTYLGAISAFNAYKCQFKPINCDNEGMILSELEEVLKNTNNIKFIYVVPDFQNPTGLSWSIERRKSFMEIVTKYEVIVIEDNPYGELTFRDEILPSLKVWDDKNLVISLGTFSKILAPGLRIGWIAADKKIIEKYVLLKQAADLHTSNISQREISKYMELFDLDIHVEGIKAVYKARRDLAVNTMKEYMHHDISYTYPEGGLFIWVILPDYMSSRDLLETCIRNKIAFVPGDSFFPNGGGHNTLRLNFSNANEEKLVEGLKKLAQEIAKLIR